MKSRGVTKLRQFTKQLRDWMAPSGIVLMYHRVADVPIDPFGLCVTPKHFAEQLAVLKQDYQLLSLQQMVEAVQTRTLPKRAIAITFDDGYADNLYVAKPLLEQYGVPATVFVATGKLEEAREFWWDELDQLLLHPGTLPKTLCLTIHGKTYEWDLGKAADYRAEDYLRDRGWNWYMPQEADPGARQSLYRSLYQLFQTVSLDERQELLDELLIWSETKSRSRSTHLSLSPEEVRTLAEGDLIEIGAHTVNHPFLATLPPDLQRQEIEQSKVYLESLLNRSVTSFAYPHGNFTTTTANIVSELGFRCACSTVASRVSLQMNCFQIPRISVQDWSGDELSMHLSTWFQK